MVFFLLSLSLSPVELQILNNEMTQQVNVSRETEKKKKNKLGDITKAKIPPVLAPRLVCEAWVFSLIEMFAY